MYSPAAVLILLSPAKALDFETPIPYLKATWPRLLNESVQLVDVMRDKSVAELAKLNSLLAQIIDRLQDRDTEGPRKP